MKLKFKTFQTPNGEFGILDWDFQERLQILTSMTPTLYQPTATLELIKKHYNGMILSSFSAEKRGETFNWDTHTPDWKLVDIEVIVKDETTK